MLMKEGEIYHCTNPACNGEVVVRRASELEGGSVPRCSCGSPMKKPYIRPQLRELTEPEAKGMRHWSAHT